MFRISLKLLLLISAVVVSTSTLQELASIDFRSLSHYELVSTVSESDTSSVDQSPIEISHLVVTNGPIIISVAVPVVRPPRVALPLSKPYLFVFSGQSPPFA